NVQLELVQAGVPAVTAAGPAATDTDPEVRRLGLDVFQLAAMALADMVGEATAAVEELPPAGRPWSEAERNRVKTYAEGVETERTRLLPLATALQGQTRAVGRA